MEKQDSTWARLIGYIVAALMLTSMAFEWWALVFWVRGTWDQRVSAVLGVVGTYGLAIGFFSKSEALVEFRDTLKDLTSPNIFKYLAGNFHFLTYPPLFMEVALCTRRSKTCPIMLGVLGSILCLVLTPFVLIYIVFHILVIVPLTYLPTVLASSIVAVIVHSGTDFRISTGDKNVSIKNIVERDEVAAKAFLIGIPGVVLSLLAKIAVPLIRG